MSLIDELTKWFDRKQSNVQHLSDITDEQKQKWYDERANQFMKNYEDAYLDKVNFTAGKNSDAGWWHQNSAQPMDGLAPKAIGDGTADPYVYEFTYYTPKNGGSMDDGEKVARKGLVYMLTGRHDGSSYLHEGENPTKDHYVYEAILDDGTTLSAKEFQDFVTANSHIGSRGFKLNSQPLNEQLSNWNTTQKHKKEAMDYYNQIKYDYVTNPINRQDPYAKNVYWDKQKRMWMAR